MQDTHQIFSKINCYPGFPKDAGLTTGMSKGQGIHIFTDN